MQTSSCFPALLALIAVPIFSAQPPGPKPVTVDSLLAQHAGHVIAPVWSPDRFAFAYQQGGFVYLYNLAKRKSTEWFEISNLESSALRPTAAKEFGWQNRRVSSVSLQWMPNSKDLLVDAGGDLFLANARGQFEQLTKTDFAEEDPRLSPDGKQILYRSASNLYLLDVASHQARQITSDGSQTVLNGQLDWVYPEELDLGNASWWSPDSKQFAFLRFDISREFVYPQVSLTGERALFEPERYPQAGTANASVKLGVYSLATGKTTWMDVGETADSLVARVIWLPDSSQLSVERLSRVQDKLDLLFFDPATGAGRTILHESSKTWINFTDNLVFLKNQPEFLWTSERDGGFRHLYRYSNTGEMLARLTQGDWEAKEITAVDEASQKVFFTSSETSPLETQLYSMPIAGGDRARITPEAGVHLISSASDGAYFLDAFSNSKQPASQVLRDASGRQLAVLNEPDWKASKGYELLPSEIVKLTAEDGTLLYGRLTKPTNYQSGTRYPLIVQVYGGPGAQAVREEWQGLNMAQVFAHAGYLVWQMDNRGSAGRGHKFEEPIYRELGTWEVADQRFGVEQLVKRGLADPARVGITGWSYGGYMTIHALLLAPDVFKAGVAGAPVTDWHNYDTIYTERYMDQPRNNLEKYNRSSNVAQADRLRGSLLIIHNFEDDNVLFQNTMQMASALEKAGKLFFMQVYPQKTHGVTGAYRKALYESELNFFNQYLKRSN